MHNLVSIIIPNYNRASLIGETLDSILAQSYKNWECIIVDDGSTDHSLEVINKYVEKDNRFSLHERPKDYPKGANACRNIGMRKSQGDYVIFFDSDDLMTEHHIALKLSFIRNGNYDFAIFKTMNFGEINDDEIYNDYTAYLSNELNANNYLLNKIRIFTLDLIVKKELINKCEFYFRNQADIENALMTQLVLLSNNCAFSDTIVSKRRVHKNNLTNDVLNNNKVKLLHKFYYHYNILDYIYTLKASPEAKQYILNQLLYSYRQMNFTFEVNFFEMMSKIIRFKKLNVFIGFVVQRVKKTFYQKKL